MSRTSLIAIVDDLQVHRESQTGPPRELTRRSSYWCEQRMRPPASTTSMKVRMSPTSSIVRSVISDTDGRHLMLLLWALERQLRGPFPTETAMPNILVAKEQTWGKA